jgi:hypothetical protein
MMEQTTLLLVLQLKEQIRQEKQKYIKAIEEGKEFFEAKEIMRNISILQAELDKLISSNREGYQGF